jgi:hypothetical protein
MPKRRRLTTDQAFAAPVAIAQDHGLPVSLEPHPPGVRLRVIRPCSLATVTLASLGPAPDSAQLVAEIHTQCGYDITVEMANRRWAGRPPIGTSELLGILDGLAGDGFDEAPYAEIEKMWRAGTELEATLILLRWAALMHHAPDAAFDGPTLSHLVARQAGRLVAVAETSLNDARIRRRIDRLVPAMRRAQPMTEMQMIALTADLPRQCAFAKFDWPWLTQRMAARGTLGRRPGDDQPAHTSP